MSERLPKRIYLGRFCQFSLEHLFCSFDFRASGEKLMGFIVPPFQRPPVWKKNQSVKFMESLILGLPVGSYTYCTSFDIPKTDGWLVDGQQRIRAVAAYVNNEFSVFGLKWGELTKQEQRQVKNVGFPAYQLQDATEEECLERYIAMNYSGTAHTAGDKSKALRYRSKVNS